MEYLKIAIGPHVHEWTTSKTISNNGVIPLVKRIRYVIAMNAYEITLLDDNYIIVLTNQSMASFNKDSN